MPFAATRTDLKIVTLSEARKRHTIQYHSYVEILKKKKVQMNVSTKQK